MNDRDLYVKVMKAGRDLRLLAANADKPTCLHVDRAAKWSPSGPIRIHGVSIPEQSEVSIYADIEVSTAPEMYVEDGHIFRVKYAGPAVQHNPPRAVQFSGSNITTTNIMFPAGCSIAVAEKAVIYVHLDLMNHSPYTIDHMTQDVYIYHSKCSDVLSI